MAIFNSYVKLPEGKYQTNGTNRHLNQSISPNMKNMPQKPWQKVGDLHTQRGP